jgi:hypothetical protein
MAAIFFAMVSESPAWDILLYLGVGLGIMGTVAYVRTGMRQLATA